MNLERMSMVLIPELELAAIKSTQQEILQYLKEIKSAKQESVPLAKNITAMEFMAAVKIKRTKFDQLVADNKIKIIKKKRKIYVPVSEIDRYFNDPSVQ